MEILNDCTDVDEIKFQEDGTWCPMRPKKEALKVPSPCIQKIDCKFNAVLKIENLLNLNLINDRMFEHLCKRLHTNAKDPFFSSSI